MRLTPVASAKAAGLRYVSDAQPGIQRKRYVVQERCLDAGLEFAGLRAGALQREERALLKLLTAKVRLLQGSR